MMGKYPRQREKVLKKALTTIWLLIGILGPCWAAEPYYAYIHSKNPKLSPGQIGEILKANQTYSAKYKVNMYWHLCKTGHESEFKPTVGNSFVVGGKKYNNEPCYGIECLQ